MRILLLILLVTPLFQGLAQAQERCAFVFEQDRSMARKFLNQELDNIQTLFADSKHLSDDQKLKLLMNEEVRKNFFRLQGLSQMVKAQNKKFFAKKTANFKDWQGVFGDYDLAVTLRKISVKIDEPVLETYFRAKELQAKEALLRTMKDSGLWESPEQTVRLLKAKLDKKGHWSEDKKERKLLIENLQDQAEEVQKGIKAGIFDSPDIEKGLHRLRRQLRSLLIQVNALRGLVELQPEEDLPGNISGWFNELYAQNPKMLNSRYTKPSEVLVDQPIKIPQYEFSIISELAGTIGDYKDVAEAQIYFKEALESMGISPAYIQQVQSKIEKHFEMEPFDHQTVSRQIQTRLAETKLLKHYVKGLKTMNEQKKR